MNLDALADLLEEIATERVTTDWKIKRFANSVNLEFEDGDLERQLNIQHTDETVTIDYSVFYDDYTANERNWTHGHIAQVNEDYASVISAAVQEALTTVNEVTKDDLEVVDGLKQSEE